jgi:hypothetical protein
MAMFDLPFSIVGLTIAPLCEQIRIKEIKD